VLRRQSGAKFDRRLPLFLAKAILERMRLTKWRISKEPPDDPHRRQASDAQREDIRGSRPARGRPHSLCVRTGSRPYADYTIVGRLSQGKDDDLETEEAASL
jgi:hypothetical protein